MLYDGIWLASQKHKINLRQKVYVPIALHAPGTSQQFINLNSKQQANVSLVFSYAKSKGYVESARSKFTVILSPPPRYGHVV